MGRTVPSYRIATEMERSKSKIFRQRLDKNDRKEYDKLFSYSRLYNSAGSNACRPYIDSSYPDVYRIRTLQATRDIKKIRGRLKRNSVPFPDQTAFTKK